jgi:hypothetical protein
VTAGTLLVQLGQELGQPPQHLGILAAAGGVHFGGKLSLFRRLGKRDVQVNRALAPGIAGAAPYRRENGCGTARDVVVHLVRLRPRFSLTPGAGHLRGR